MSDVFGARCRGDIVYGLRTSVLCGFWSTNVCIQSMWSYGYRKNSQVRIKKLTRENYTKPILIINHGWNIKRQHINRNSLFFFEKKNSRYWANVDIPHGTMGFQAVCPFCATPLDGSPGYIKLIFQDNLD